MCSLSLKLSTSTVPYILEKKLVDAYNSNAYKTFIIVSTLLIEYEHTVDYVLQYIGVLVTRRTFLNDILIHSLFQTIGRFFASFIIGVVQRFGFSFDRFLFLLLFSKPRFLCCLQRIFVLHDFAWHFLLDRE